MNNIFRLDGIKGLIEGKQLLKGLFGIEREGLRVYSNGNLALTPHPKVFGDKLENPVITTDFSESQIEIVTPCLNSIDEAYKHLDTLTDIVNTNIPENQYFWNQSLPCILPSFERIPIAEYAEDENSLEARKYREGLVEKYGTQKQMISGIHYNFSFDNDVIKNLYEKLNLDITYREFKNQLYLKIVRNYLRYDWLVIYLTGSTIAAHKTFTKECLNLLDNSDNEGSFYNNHSPSIRNGSTGYKNLVPLYPRYDSIEHFVSDVESFVNEGKLSQAKELYTSIRLKPKDNSNILESLKSDGVQYVEIRTIDINPFEKTGISKLDMEFVHLFMIYLLFKDESNYSNWQEEGVINCEKVAENGYDNVALLKDGVEINLRNWALEIFDEISFINKELDLGKEDIISLMKERVLDLSKTYGHKLLKVIKDDGYLKGHINFSIDNKRDSLENIKDKSDLLKFYEDIALFDK